MTQPVSSRIALVATLATIVVAVLCAALTLALSVSACGGSGSGSTLSPSASTTRLPVAAASAAAVDFLEARTQALVQGSPAQALRRLCAPQSRLADSVLWWAAGTRASRRGREIGVPPQGYETANVRVMVRHATVDAQAGTASVLAFTTPGPSDTRNVDSNREFHLVTLVKSGDGTWLASGDTSTSYERDLPVFLRAGGAPPAVVAAALATVRRAKHPGAPPVGCLETLRSWCAAMNTHDAAALKATYTPDSDIQSVSDAEIKAGFAAGSPPHQRDWRVTGMKLLGLQLDGVACGWVGYHFMSDDPASMTGSRGHAAFAFLERQPDGRWLIFSPAE